MSVQDAEMPELDTGIKRVLFQAAQQADCTFMPDSGRFSSMLDLAALRRAELAGLVRFLPPGSGWANHRGFTLTEEGRATMGVPPKLSLVRRMTAMFRSGRA